MYQSPRYFVTYEMNLDAFVSAPTMQGWKSRTVEFDFAYEAIEFIDTRKTMPDAYRSLNLEVK